MKKVVKASRPDLPIFGVDIEEVEALRQLASVVGRYLDNLDEIHNRDEVAAAYHSYLRIKRSKRTN